MTVSEEETTTAARGSPLSCIVATLNSILSGPELNIRVPGLQAGQADEG